MLDLLFTFVGCTCLWPTHKYVGLLDPSRRTFEQVCFSLPNYFIFIFMSLFYDGAMLYLIADSKVCTNQCQFGSHWQCIYTSTHHSNIYFIG
jgi:hypothetical protein